MINGIIDTQYFIYYYGALFGIVIVFFICRKFCFKRRWGENY